MYYIQLYMKLFMKKAYCIQFSNKLTDNIRKIEDINIYKSALKSYYIYIILNYIRKISMR
jgi:hypothetical protein